MPPSHGTARLEAFCDAVFAIAMTLLVIELKPPHADGIATTAGVWQALGHMAPAVFAFVLSFTIILIAWVNHHGALRLVRATTASFIYANGFLLLTVVFIPFPTALLGEFIGTDRAAPAVVLYNAVIALQAVGWILLSTTALNNGLAIDEQAAAAARDHRRKGGFAFALYALLAVLAIWFPMAVAIVTTLTWVVWLVLGIRLRHA
jgi:uncharacterized membrane protein